ncbi:MAG: hypothetical protein HC786_09380 [Richelia sp. CSU_2_1]|nr:hypothetical protein [Richelia sp. CSU_2_1]
MLFTIVLLAKLLYRSGRSNSVSPVQNLDLAIGNPQPIAKFHPIFFY